jgi:diaminohydroxyphosphoribosylaminopyrimidine deaminase / 5-amino-6-(5-phosphoribosylamino)uracil reductase
MRNLMDSSYLEMAYGLAEKAKGWARPNPYVGAVLVRKGKIVGYGYHERPGKAHAEIIALDRAGPLARGSTLFVTLEPCVQWGRTPPCLGAVLRAGLARVVISSPDPNPVVFNKGIRALRAAGLDVSVGLLEERNRILNETYYKYITRGIPFVTLKAAVSLDGRISSKLFDSRWISSARTREYVHLVRGEYDAIMVGIHTVLKDDPRLTVRHPHWQGKKIARVILDSHLRLPLEARILSTLRGGKVIVFTSKRSPAKKAAALREKGVEVVRIPGSAQKLELREVLRWLGKAGISSLLVEGGSRVLTAMVEERLADKLFLTISPRLIGGEKAPSFFEGKGIRRISESLELQKITSFKIGGDMIVEGYF